MTKIYLSSTYSDLIEYRKAAYNALRQMRHDVIAMEDYIATGLDPDHRPLNKCMKDVSECEVYVGIFAWRYGFIPPEGNPTQKSITELEYREALNKSIPRFIFLLHEDAPWPRTAMDKGSNEERIEELRKELVQKELVSFFRTAEELAGLIGRAISNWEKRSKAEKVPAIDPFQERKSRLKGMLADHSLFIRDRLESFVGRNKELADLRARITEEQRSGGYVTITGQAGQGKSSIIAKLVDEHQEENIAIHFIPFNPGPDHQVGLLRNILARLILKYDLPDWYVASESYPILRDYFPKVLEEVAARGGKEVIYIDGLDQLEVNTHGIRDLSFLPSNPPPGIVFVLGTRPNDTLQPLELLKPFYEYNLPNLTREDFDLILQHRHVRLSSDLANQFYQAMQENALYLDLIAKELMEQKDYRPEEIIARVASNPENLFTLTIQRLKRLSVEWREVMKPILGVLLVTREPLSLKQIRQLIKVEDDRLRDGIARLGGLLASTEQQKYALFHLKLYDYLRQNEQRPKKDYVFATDEEEQWHACFARWCEQDNLALIWHDVVEPVHTQERREYARKYYIMHLYSAGEHTRLFEVLDAGEYGRGKVHFDPSMRSYALDLELGRLAAAREPELPEEGYFLLTRLWRYSLLQCSLTSQADNYPVEAFQLLLTLKRKNEALGLAELLTQPAHKVAALILIAVYTIQQPKQEAEGIQLFERALEIVRSIPRSPLRDRALRALEIALSQVEQWKRAEIIASSISDNYEQAIALNELAVALAQANQQDHAQIIWEKAIEQARASENNDEKVEALCHLAATLTQAGQWERADAIWTEVLEQVHAGERRDEQSRALCYRATSFAQAGQWERAEAIWTEVLTRASSVKESYEQARTLRYLATTLAQAGQWPQAETIARSIKESYEQARALSKLTETLAQAGQWERAETVAHSITWPNEQARALSNLATALAQAGQWERAETIVHSIEQNDEQARALSNLATTLAQAKQWEQAEVICAEVLNQTRSIEQNDEQARALNNLATALAQAKQWERAETIARSIRWPNEQAPALSNLATALVQAKQWERAETIARSIRWPNEQARALNSLATALAQAEQWERAETIARSIRWPYEKAPALREDNEQDSALSNLATALAQAKQWERAETIARSIRWPNEQARVLSNLATALAQAGQWERAETIARSIAWPYEQARALSKLTKALAQAGQWERAETIARSIAWPYEQASASRELATALAQAGQWPQAETIWAKILEQARSIKESYNHARALGELATALAQAGQWPQAETIWAKILEQARSIKEDDEQARALGELATALAQAGQWPQAEAIARSIKEGYEQVRALNNLATALAQAEQWEQAESTARSIAWRDEQARALSNLATALAQAGHWERAETIAHSIEEDNEQARALSNLATALAQAGHWERAETIAHSIEEDNEQARVLSNLATALAQAGQWERAETIARSIRWPNEQDRALSNLANALVQAGHWMQIEPLLNYSVDNNEKKANILFAAASVMVKNAQYYELLRFIQQAWLHANTQDYCLNLLKLAFGLLPLHPELGAAFYEAFTWVDDFLKG